MFEFNWGAYCNAPKVLPFENIIVRTWHYSSTSHLTTLIFFTIDSFPSVFRALVFHAFSELQSCICADALCIFIFQFFVLVVIPTFVYQLHLYIDLDWYAKMIAFAILSEFGMNFGIESPVMVIFVVLSMNPGSNALPPLTNVGRG